MKKVWFVYILECSDGTLYTGITNDLDKRIKAHNEGKGAKYTRGRGPVKLKYLSLSSSKSNASKYEAKIKKWTKKEKLEHIEYWSTKNNRILLSEVIDILKEFGWNTQWEVDCSNPGNDSTYVIWSKDDSKLYLGNYYLQGETVGAFPWAHPNVKRENILSLLKGDLKKADEY